MCQEVRKEIIKELSAVQREGIDQLINHLEGNNFFTSPASTKFHGNYVGGLAAHSLMVYKEFDFLLKRYSGTLEQDSRRIAGICHDFCKIGVYQKNELKNGRIPANPYHFDDPLPIGHGEKSMYLVSQYVKLTPKEALLIRWHMGSYDPNYEINQDKLKKICPELCLLHCADQLVSGGLGL
ncbi:MAG: metal-dependent phosphohydrolase [Nanoarchaeota archaeon]